MPELIVHRAELDEIAEQTERTEELLPAPSHGDNRNSHLISSFSSTVSVSLCSHALCYVRGRSRSEDVQNPKQLGRAMGGCHIHCQFQYASFSICDHFKLCHNDLLHALCQ